jgi:hypothetical protein
MREGGPTVKKLLITCVALVLLMAGAGGAAYLYIAPDEELDLIYAEVPLRDRLLEMAGRLSTELTLTEADVNNLAKASLARNPEVADDLEITGARFELKEDRVVAHVNVRWKARIPAGAVVEYRLSWQPPYLVATPVKARIKNVSLPRERLGLGDIAVPLGEHLPKGLQIEKVHAGEGKLTVSFRKPSLPDLRGLRDWAGI